MSEFHVYDENKVPLDLIRNDESIQWLEMFQETGEAKIIVQATDRNREILVDGNRIWNKDCDTAVQIVRVDDEETDEGTSLVVRAFHTGHLLRFRVVMATENVSNVEAGMYSVYAKNRRGLSVEMAEPAGYPDIFNTEITWNSVLDAEVKIAQAAGFGFKVLFDPETGAETFKVYKGTDRTDEESENYVGYFSADLGNIADTQISKGSEDYYNVAVVAGAGEGPERVVRIVSIGEVSGDNRRELYVDRRDLQPEYQVLTQTGTDSKGNPTYSSQTRRYTEAEYNALLDNAGYEALAEHLFTNDVEFAVNENTLRYGKHYFLGDRMPAKLQEGSLMASALVLGVKLIYEGGDERRAEPILGDFRLEDVA